MNKQIRSGFTLMETLLAIAVTGILLSTFLAVFGPAANTIRRAISVQEADRLATALEQELSTLRQEEAGQFNTSFDKAFEWVSNSGSLSNATILFNYRGDTGQIVNGQLAPFVGVGSPGEDYIVQSVVRNLGDTGSDLENLLQAVEGSAYVVQMRQLVQNANGGLTPAQAGASLSSSQGNAATNAADFDDAVIAFQADFYALGSNTFGYINNTLRQGGTDFTQILGEPLFSRAMAVRR